MRNRSKASVLALCGVLAALAVALMFLGGVIPFAAIACPVLASLVLIPVYAETGKKWSLLWYAAVAILGLLLAPDKEAAILFAFLVRNLLGMEVHLVHFPVEKQRYRQKHLWSL